MPERACETRSGGHYARPSGCLALCGTCAQAALYIRADRAEELPASPGLPASGTRHRHGLHARQRPARSEARRPGQEEPYECGLPSDVKKSFRFGISFYLVAMLFILFDIEVVFLYPVAVQLEAFGWFALGGDDRLRRCCCSWPSSSCGEGGRSNGSDPHERRPSDMRVRQLRAQQMLRGDIEGDDLEQYVEERVLLTTLEEAQNWARKNALFPLGFGLACCAIEMITMIGSPRNDLVALRRRGDPLLPAPGGHADHLRPRLDQDGAGHPAALRPDARAEVGDLHGRLRVERRDVQQLRARRGRRQVPARGRVRARLPAAPGGADLRDHEAAGQDQAATPTSAGASATDAEGTEEVA